MNTQEMIQQIKYLKAIEAKSKRKNYDFDLLERMIIKLVSFTDCNECKELLGELTPVLKEIENSVITKTNKAYSTIIDKLKTHLREQHNLVTPNYYAETYMLYGLSFGSAIGIIISMSLNQMAFIGFGLPIGMLFGQSIGAIQDEKAKKDGTVI
ncbi:hypothetical protein EDC18_101470 [Natranaerovirga pectinivora]|uniref:Uncharacterized protein n=1 Tax=Natranaerovirga pectinivora TaxID=682400 RepID=A0A4R3MQK3_9FIRM|nr:hypothetical protein [Natranaerovirga pectinivora]TCT17172.1 hypothetical protein EDC18_101470 [Natranaerovirga pectinivora]